MRPFLFSRGTKTYARFTVPTAHQQAIGRKFLTFALGECPAPIARLHSCILEIQLTDFFKGDAMGDSFDLSRITKFEINVERGIYKASPGQDTTDMLSVIRELRSAGALSPPAPYKGEMVKKASPPTPSKGEATPSADTGGYVLLPDLLEKFFTLKNTTQGTQSGYRSTISEFVKWYKLPTRVDALRPVDFTRYREHLGSIGNTPRTIDKKIGTFKSVLNFAIEQNYIPQGTNPAVVKNLLTKKQKALGGWALFEQEEISALFDCDYFREQKEQDPDYYFALLLVLVTGARHEEIAQLTRGQIKVSTAGTNFITIRHSKTLAGIRDVPIPPELLSAGLADFIKEKASGEKIFNYKAGNALGKKFARHITDRAKIDRPKLVLHSLRKFLNDHFQKENVSFDLRCQFIGHEVEHVNITTYARKFNVEELRKFTLEPVQKILKLAGIF